MGNWLHVVDAFRTSMVCPQPALLPAFPPAGALSLSDDQVRVAAGERHSVGEGYAEGDAGEFAAASKAAQ
jgi:hypothetical protein